MELSDPEKTLLLETAREAIAARIERRSAHYSAPTERLLLPRAAFVTLRIEGELRGCIGRMTSNQSLFETVKQMATASAFEDPRFVALTAAELGRARIEISVLGPLETVSGIDEIMIGTHGVYLQNGGRSGVLLPQVAVEQRWDVPAFLTHACRKAGLGCDAWKLPATVIQVFSAIIFGEQGSHP